MNRRNLKRIVALFMSVVLIVTGIKLTNRETYAADYPTAPGDDSTINVSYYDLPEYSEDDILGAAQHFLLFGKESATIGTHTNGNIAAPTLNTLIDTAGGSFVMNGMQALGYVIPNGNYRLISYIGDAKSDSQYMGIKGNGHLLVVDGDSTVLSSDKRKINGKQLADDFTNVLYENPNVAFIDFEKEFAHFERLSQKLVDFRGNRHKTRADVIEGDGQVCTLTVGNGVTVLSLTAKDLDTSKAGSIRKDFHLIDIQSQGQLTDKDGKTYQVVSANQVVIINVDLAGETDYNMVHDVKYRFIDGELVANNESTVYNGTNIIWNFYDSSASDKLYRGQITTSGYTMGVLLAPAATIRAHASNGTVIGKNVATYQGECHRSDFLPKSIPGLKLYKLTYDKNADDAYLGSGDTAVTDATVYEYNKPATVKNNNDTSTPGNWRRDGYKFLGWSENASDTKPTYKAGDTIKMNSDKTLYANWEKLPQYTVTYHKTIAEATGSQTDSKSPYYKGTTVTVLDQGTMAATGYEFLGWNPDEAAAKTGTVDTNYDPADTFTITKDMDLYAVWAKIPKYTVTYHKTIDAATKAPVDAKSPYLKNSTVTVLGAGAMKAEGYKFLGWNPDENAAKAGTVDTNYDPADTFKITKNTDLYAVWEKLPQYKVTYHEVIELAGGNAPKDNNLYYGGAKVTVLDDSTMQAPSNFTFNGWNTNKEAAQKGEIEFKPGQKFEIQADTDLYALWYSQPLYKVTYHPTVTLTGGTVPTDTTGYLADETVTVSDAGTMVADGYKFAGWNPNEKQAKEGKTDPNYDPADTFKITKDTDLYAVWTPYVKVTYHPVITLTSGSAPVDANSPYLKGANVTVLGQGTMVSDAYDFIGWNPIEAEAKKGKVDTNYDPSDSFTITKDTDLYAVWQPKVSVTYVSPITLTGGSEPVDANNPYRKGAPVTVLDQGTMVAEGYNFLGWNTDKGGALSGNADPAYAPGLCFEINDDTILYAVWKPIPTYSVTYHEMLKEASAAPVDSDSPYYENSTVTILDQGTMKADGYAFLGWNPDEAAAKAGTVDSAYDPADTFTITKDTDLYAVWKKLPTYTVTYHETLSTATAAPNDVNNPYYEGTNVTVLGQGTMKANGYVFRGWNPSEKDAKAGTVDASYDPADTFTITKDTDLYAVWKKYYTVGYDPDGGVPTPEDTTEYADGATVTITSELPVKEGFTFAGWSQDPTDSTKPVLKAGDKTTKIQGSDITFIAVWTPNYNVTYYKNADDATGTQKDINNPYESGETVTVLGSSSIVRSGYSFLGWNTDAAKATAGEVEFKADDTFTITKDTDLYAVWKKYYVVGYDPNGGSGEPSDDNRYYDGDKVTVPSDVPSKKGFDFKGWSTDPSDPDAPLYQVGDTVTVNGKDITFTAVWSKINSQPIVVYAVTYDPTGGVPTPEDTTEYVDGATVIVTDDVPAKDGFTFVGWSMDPADPNAKLLKGGDTTTIQSDNITFTAIWTPNYVVIYNKNADDATGTQKDLNNPYESGETVTVLGAGEIARTGYVFKGWATTASDTMVTYTEGSAFVITADTTLYAVWEALPTYKVVYDPNGGSGEPADVKEYKDGDTVTVPADEPVKTGYIFQGWTLDPSDPDAKLLKNGDTTTIQGHGVTFTAVWKADPNTQVVVLFKVTYDPQGGSPAPVDTTEYVDGATVIVTSDVPVKDGFVLDGWTLDPNAATPVLLAGGQTTKINGSDLTFYAVWTPVYTVDYSADGASSTPKDEKKYRNGEKAVVVKDIPVVEGKTFKGWTTDPADTSNLLQNGDTVTIDGKNIILYAVFENNASSTFTVKYDLNGAAGTAPVDSNTYESGSSVTIVRDIPSRDGYTFTGWSLTSDGSATYNGGDTYQISSDTTFYAIWTPNASGAKTGDPTEVTPWAMLALVSAAGCALAVAKGKKKEDEE